MAAGRVGAPARDRHEKTVIAILLVLSVIVLPAVMGWIGTPESSSYVFNMPWFVAFEAALAEGVPYPRHLPEIWYGLGGLDFFFYGPLPFYVAAGPARWICQGCTVQTVFALQAGLFWGASILAFYPFARRFVAAIPAAAASCTYAILPYHLSVDWFNRLAIGEFAAYAFVPVVALGFLIAVRERRINLALPLGAAGIFFAHLPTALLAAHVFAAVFIVYAFANPRAAGPLFLRLAAMALTGAAIAAVYWLPSVVLLKDVSPEALYDLEIMKPKPWLFFYDSLLPGRRWHRLDLYFLILALGCALTVFVRAREKRTEVLAWALAPLVLIFVLNTPLSVPIWDHWVINLVQFPWRLMVFVDFSAALLVGWLVAHLLAPRAADDRPPRHWLVRLARARAVSIAALLAVGLAVVAQYPLIHKWSRNAMQINGAPIDMQGTLEYLPPGFYDRIEEIVTARDLPFWYTDDVIREWLAEFDAPGSGILPVVVRSRRWEAEVSTAGPVVLRLPYWRHMVAETEAGVPVPIAVEPVRGLTEAVVPEGARSVIIRLPWHWSEYAGLGLSLAGLLALAAIAALPGNTHRRRRNS